MNVQNFRHILIFQFEKFQKFPIPKISKMSNLENYPIS